jgi:hypothetical protein
LGLGFRVSGLMVGLMGFRFGVRVSGFWFGVSVYGFGLGFRV